MGRYREMNRKQIDIGSTIVGCHLAQVEWRLDSNLCLKWVVYFAG
jgi:hypothetical protein